MTKKIFFWILLIALLLSCRTLTGLEVEPDVSPVEPILPLKTATSSLLLIPPATGQPSFPNPSPTARSTVQGGLIAGKPSIGDPYAPELGNTGYDVQHYSLSLALDPRTTELRAEVVIQAIATLEGIEQFSLDFSGFDIESLLVDGAPARYIRERDKLIINLPAPLGDQTPFTVAILYRGSPPMRTSRYVPFIPQLGMFHQVPGNIFVVSEPDGGHSWFPCNDHPRDKATFLIELAVSPGLIGAANGILLDFQEGVNHPLVEDGPVDVYTWSHNHPMATYLATVAVGDYERLEDSSPSGIPLRHYIFPDNQNNVDSLLLKTGEMIDWLSELLIPYPFEAFGYVLVRDLGASLETQTLVILDDQMVNETTLMHEMAHMWFGDWVSLDSWGDMWRNEGFATYFSLLWETRDRPDVLEQKLQMYVQFYEEHSTGYALNNPPPADLFGIDSYYKGALLVHELRQKLGDEAFFGGLRTYFERYGGGTATHDAFQTVMEEAAGISLDKFFEEWFAAGE